MLMAYWYTGQERYVEGMKQYILHWVRQNTKETFGSLMTRTIDTGIRCASWTPLLLHLLAKEHINEVNATQVAPAERLTNDVCQGAHQRRGTV